MSELLALSSPNSNGSHLKVEWNIGRRCNFDCSYCSHYIHDAKSPFLPFDVMKRVVDTLAEVVPQRRVHVSLTGGEPALHPNLIELADYMRLRGIQSIHLTTNGSRSVDYYRECLKYFNSIIFSFHFEYARRERLLETIVACAEWARKSPIIYNVSRHFLVHLMMLPDYFDEARNVIHVLEEHRINYALRRIRPLYDGAGSPVRPHGSQGQLRFTAAGEGPDYSGDVGYYSAEELEFLNQHQPNEPRNLIEYRYNAEGAVVKIPSNVNAILRRKENQFLGWQCRSGLDSLAIFDNGDVYRASCRVGGRLGNILEGGFKTPDQPVSCTRTWCVCAAEINTAKWKLPLADGLNEVLT